MEVLYLHQKHLFGGTVPPSKKLFGGTIPPNNFFGGGTLMESFFWQGKGDIPIEKCRLTLQEVYFQVGDCGVTDSAGEGSGQK